jgi:hypothetical protein
MAVSINEANSMISSFLRSGPFSNIKFDKYGDRTYVSYISDELNGVYLRAFGGDYESSISVSYSVGRGLYIEVYFSSSKARQIWHTVPMIVREGLADYGYDSFTTATFTKFVPGQTALTFDLETHPSTAMELSSRLNKLASFVRDLTGQF